MDHSKIKHVRFACFCGGCLSLLFSTCFLIVGCLSPSRVSFYYKESLIKLPNDDVSCDAQEAITFFDDSFFAQSYENLVLQFPEYSSFFSQDEMKKSTHIYLVNYYGKALGFRFSASYSADLVEQSVQVLIRNGVSLLQTKYPYYSASVQPFFLSNSVYFADDVDFVSIFSWFFLFTSGIYFFGYSFLSYQRISLILVRRVNI